MKLHEFLDSRIARPTIWPRNSHVTHPKWAQLYVRCGKRYLDGKLWEPVIELASIEAKEPGKGAFKALLAELREAYPQAVIYVEQVHNGRFRESLPHMGFTQREDGEPSYYLLPAKS